MGLPFPPSAKPASKAKVSCCYPSPLLRNSNTAPSLTPHEGVFLWHSILLHAMLDINLPLLTDRGAKEFGSIATENLGKIVPEIVPSKTTVVCIFVLAFGWLAFSFYKESRTAAVKHTVEHSNRAQGPTGP